MSKTYFEELEIRTLKMYLEVQSIILYIIMYSGRRFKIVVLNKKKSMSLVCTGDGMGDLKSAESN